MSGTRPTGWKNFGVAALLLLAGCSSGGSLRHADRTITPADIREAVAQNHGRVHALQGSGRITFETPEMAQSGSFELALLKPDSVLVRLEGPFGLDIGSALVTREEFALYDSFNNRLVTGPTNARNLSRIFRLPIEFDDVLNLFTGGIFMPQDRTDPDNSALEGDELVLRYDRADGSRIYRINPESLMIERIQFIDGSGKLVLEQRFSEFITIDGIHVPRSVRVTMHRDRRMMSISYSDLSLNIPLQLGFHVPHNASRVRWQ